MNVARIVFQSPRLDTYADIVAAISSRYPEISEIRLVFIDRDTDEEKLNELQKRLIELADLPDYKTAARLRISGLSCSLQSPQLYSDPGVIDVTATAKHIAIEVATSCMEYPHLKVCQFRWSAEYEKDKHPRVGRDEYVYEDLMSIGATGRLLKNYVAKKHVLRVFVVLFSTMLVVFVLKFFVPGFRVPDDVINFFSLLIGAAGLWLSMIALRKG